MALAASAVPVAAHDLVYGSKVTLDGYGEAKPRVITHFFTGRVKSPKPACKPNRTVKVYRENEGPDTLIGTALSDASGHWSLGNDVAGPGDYYAKLIRKDIGKASHDHLCKRALSDALEVP